jgi:transcription termination/antitermination protein NusA
MPNDDADVINRLFLEEIPEVAAGVVEIKGIARKPGFRCKIALYSHDPKVDCIGVCVGVRGHRIKRIVDQLDGERIDLFRWDSSLDRLIRNSLQPAQIETIVLHPDQHRATVIVKEDQLTLAVGRRAMNRDLASQICAWDIEIVALSPPTSF